MKRARDDQLDGERVTIEEEGDCLCQLAIDAGFPDCGAIRGHAQNSGKPFLNRPLRAGDVVFVPDKDPKKAKKGDKEEHKFKRAKASVMLRFVHGTNSAKPEDDPALTDLCVSNMRPDRGNDDRKGVFPDDTVTGYNAIGDGDPDSFKVEVVDARTKKDELKVTLEALKPTFDGVGAVTGHGPFDAGERAKRSLEVKPKKVAPTTLFLSPYLKLVVDQQDKDARPKQMLLTAPAPDVDEKIEILDQQVQAVYELDWCPGAGDAKCKVTRTLDVGRDKKRVKVAIHVLRKTRTGDGVLDIPTIKKRLFKFMRELYAQSDMSMEFTAEPRLVPPPQNMIAIANEDGKGAVGAKKIKIAITVDKRAFDAEITTTLGDDPIKTADKLKAAIETAAAALAPPLALKVFTDENPVMPGQPVGSADVIVGEPLIQEIDVSVVTSDDANHKAVAAKLTSTKVTEFGAANGGTGTLDERVLVKNYESAKDHVDVFIVGEMSDNSFGEGWIPSAHKPAPQRPNARMVNSVIMRTHTLTGDNVVHRTLPHECGHVLMDLVHATDPEEMMHGALPKGQAERVIDAPKRISDPISNANFIGFNASGGNVNPTRRLRESNVTLVTGW